MVLYVERTALSLIYLCNRMLSVLPYQSKYHTRRMYCVDKSREPTAGEGGVAAIVKRRLIGPSQPVKRDRGGREGWVLSYEWVTRL